MSPVFRRIGVFSLTVVLATLASVWIVKTYVFPSRFQPVVLDRREEKTLDAKLRRLEGAEQAVAGAPRTEDRYADHDGADRGSGAGALKPEPYVENASDREVTLSEREVNALLSRNTDLARRVAIDLSGGLISAKVLIPVDPDFPIVGGRTIRVRAGVILDTKHRRPVVALKGVSVMGVPIPNAWLGGLKNIDLVEKFGGDAGPWKTFAAGIEDIEVSDGRLRIRLKE